jgi:putative selenium metabolism protein SsnA
VTEASLLTGGLVAASLDPPRVERRDLAIEAGRVAGGAGEGTSAIDVSGCLVIPGNVCAHMHLYSALARGMPYRLAPPTDFLQILRRIWWRLDRALDEASIRASALLGGAEALLAGTTTLVDHHASPEAIDGSLDVMADALESLGLRSVLAYEVTDRDGPERAGAGLEENRRFAKETAGRSLTRAMVGAHASFTLSEETLAGCVDVARDAGVGLHVHVAEDDADERDAMARFGKRTVGRLSDAGALTEQDLLAHGVHLDHDEIQLVSACGCSVAHNPRSNMNNGVGRAPVGRLPNVVLGTDGIDGDLFAESRAAFWRRREEDLGAGPGEVLSMLARGARLAGRSFGEPGLGSLEAGAPADLVVLEYPEPTPVSGGNLGGHWMFGLDASRVRDVMVAGRWVVRERRLTLADQDEIAATAREAAGRLWRRMDDIGEHPFAPRSGGGGSG